MKINQESKDPKFALPLHKREDYNVLKITINTRLDDYANFNIFRSYSPHRFYNYEKITLEVLHCFRLYFVADMNVPNAVTKPEKLKSRLDGLYDKLNIKTPKILSSNHKMRVPNDYPDWISQEDNFSNCLTSAAKYLIEQRGISVFDATKFEIEYYSAIAMDIVNTVLEYYFYSLCNKFPKKGVYEYAKSLHNKFESMIYVVDAPTFLNR